MIQFFVPGIPAPGGSKKYVGHSKAGKAILVDDAGDRNRNWRDAVACEARRAMEGTAPLDGPLRLEITFCFNRPKGHYGSGGNKNKVRPSAPKHHTKRPDTTKLVRSTEDAMTGIVWKDDTQVVFQKASKVYRDKPGADIIVSLLDN